MPGPIPKRSEERRRRNKDATPTIKVDLSDALSQQVEIPAPPVVTHDKDGNPLDEPEHEWHPIAEEWYLSLTKSGQALFYEPSDWATAYLLAESLSRDLNPQPMAVGQGEDARLEWVVIPLKGASLTAYLKGMSSLMTTEGERRRLRIELDRKNAADAAGADGTNVIPIAQQRQDRFKREAQK